LIDEKSENFPLAIHENIVKIMELQENMNNPRLDGICREWENEAQKRRKENREWFNNLLRVGIAAIVIQLLVLVFCVWYFTR
jgi:hypothetical protein